MTYRVRNLPRVEAQIDDAATWYENQYRVLGDRFLDAVSAAEVVLTRIPRAFRVDPTVGFRSLLLNGFPYRLWYEVAGAEVHVVAFTHVRAGPQRIHEALGHPSD
jgi:hypothetical protein